MRRCAAGVAYHVAVRVTLSASTELVPPPRGPTLQASPQDTTRRTYATLATCHIAPTRTYPRLPIETSCPRYMLLSTHHAANQPRRYTPLGGMLLSRKLPRLYHLSERTLLRPGSLAMTTSQSATIVVSLSAPQRRGLRYEDSVVRRERPVADSEPPPASLELCGSLRCAASRTTPAAGHRRSVPQHHRGPTRQCVSCVSMTKLGTHCERPKSRRLCMPAATCDTTIHPVLRKGSSRENELSTTTTSGAPNS